jgi:hypothetical protein
MRSYVSVPIPALAGGVNRFEREARPDQAVEAENVINENGELQRRESFKTIACGAPHYATKGSVVVLTSDAESTPGNWASSRHGDGTFSGANIKRLYVGALDKFDGFDWGLVTASPAGDPLCGSNVFLKAYYSKTSGDSFAWESVSHIKDTTQAAAGNYRMSLLQEGQVSFHSSLLTDWTPITVTGVSGSDLSLPTNNYYWVRVDIIKASDNTATRVTNAAGDSLTLAAPGVRVFQLNPVNGLFPIRIGDRNVTVVCNDRQRSGGSDKRRPHEPGAQIGTITSDAEPTDMLRMVEDEGCGVYGQITWPSYTTSGSTAGSSSGNTLGTANFLRKNITDYDWLFDSVGTVEPRFGQFRGGVVAEGLPPENDIAYANNVVSFAKIRLSPGYKELDHCRLRITTQVSSGNAVGHEREIFDVTETSTNIHVHLYHDFDGVIDAGDRFAIIRPHARAIINDVDYEVHQHSTSNGHELRLVNGGANDGRYASNPASLDNSIVHWELSREFRWVMDSGKNYSGVQHIGSNTLIFTNGKGTILEYDGRRVRELYVDTESETAKQIAGEIADKLVIDENEFRLFASNQLLSKPPRGQFICDYKGHIIVADPETNELRYSAMMNPYIWPIINILSVKDSENNKITGMAVLGEYLFVFTATQIFRLGPFDINGRMPAKPTSHGVGFVSHWAVEKIPLSGQSVLLGASADGVYAYNGGEPVAVLDDWKRLLPEGVNKSRLSNAVTAVDQSRNHFYLAVASAGSDKNDRILVFDYYRKVWWVWTHPQGISAMATDFNEKGEERVLFGTNDGHVQVLTQGPDDGGVTITGKVKSAPLQMFGDREGSLVAALVSVEDLGAGNTLTVNTYLDKKATQAKSKSLTVDGRQAVFGSATFDTDAFADERFIEKRINQPYKTRGHKFQLEISGTDRWKTRDMSLLARVLERRGK